jgi:hypothetical protein
MINSKECERWCHQFQITEAFGMEAFGMEAFGMEASATDPDPPNPDMLPGQFMLKWPN